METKTYKVEGLSCIDCAGRIQASVAHLDTVQRCEVDHATGNLTVWVTTPDFDVTPVEKIVADTGHTLVTERHRHKLEPVSNRSSIPLVAFTRFLLSKRDTTLTTIAGVLTLLGLIATRLPLPTFWSITAFALAVILGGFPVTRHAFQEIARVHSLGINTLMVIAVAGALAIGEWAEAAIVVVLFALGEALEGYATERARGALESLLDLVPPTALRILENGVTKEVPVEHLRIGDDVRIRPGDRVSVDGIVKTGQSAVDQAAITGESMPVDKGPGDEVYAGTVNTFGVLEVEVTQLAADNTLNRMIALVQEAQARKAPIQRFVDRFARVYTPTVALLAVLVASVPPLFFAQPFWGVGGWLMRALQMLVIACPCALVISTPVSVVSALTHAAARGVLIKGGATLEILGRVNIIAFDKTGTLTEGHPVTTDVLNVCTVAGCNNGLQYAAAVESQSSHPLARALVTEAHAQHLTLLPAQNVSILNGRGITGNVNGTTVTVASHPYFDATVPHTDIVCREAERLAGEGKTVILVGHDDILTTTPQVCSVFAVADRPRAASPEIIADLKTLNHIRTAMLTGDSSTVANAVAQYTGVDTVYAGLLPEEKVEIVREMQEGKEEEGNIENPKSRSGGLRNAPMTVAFVGDGVNDAPALAQADVGVAMGGAGSAQAMETADVVLMGDDLRQLPFLIRLSQRTRQTVRANIIFALAIKSIVFVLAASGIATLWMAIVADVGASLAVILNGMRLRI
ncbi:MAG: cadmium-translocating P-type ATPase [Anaerolineae bacterium]|nr:cadmium-translocating P-type ATPase [Anaerolineae bacterium]